MKAIVNRAWLYSRLSRDDDAELNSLTNQQNIIRSYAESNGYSVVGESSDDNISGMHFNREGIDRIYEAVEAKSIDAVIVKDLSRLGRHRTQTAMFIDFLRENDVKVISVTENIDTSNEDDDLMVGFKGIFNDMYARDISKKIRAGYLQKQKQGIVLIPPMGYFKDKNTNEIVIMDEPAQIVKRIFRLFLDGFGMKTIAKMLNDDGVKAPGYYQKKYLNKKPGYDKPEIASRYLWNATTVKRILENEFYIGTLVCHQSYTNKINKVRKFLPEEEQIRHENFVPAIISNETFEKVRAVLESKKKTNVRAGQNKPFHRYTGLLKCADCGASFSCKTRHWKDQPERIEYVCNSYHRYGKDHCTPHRINEETLDCIINKELHNIIEVAQKNFEKVDKEFKKWKRDKGNTINMIEALESQLAQRKEDQQSILLERLRDKQRASIYTEMLEKCESDISNLESKIARMKDLNKTVIERRSELESSLEVLKRIANENRISDADLRLLIESIRISERDGKLNVEIMLNGNFRRHVDIYRDGELDDSFMEMWIMQA